MANEISAHASVERPSRVVHAALLSVLQRVGAGQSAKSDSAGADRLADAVRASPAVEAWVVPCERTPNVSDRMSQNGTNSESLVV